MTPSKRLDVHRLSCLAFLVVSGAVWLIPAFVPAYTGSGYIALHLTLTAIMLLAWGTAAANTARWSLVTGVLVRLVLVAAPAISSNDTDRYLWDGAVALAGMDPYTIAPDNPAAQVLRTLWATPAEHAAYPTLYPPGALFLFALSALAGPAAGVWVWKGLVTAAGIASLMIGDRILIRRGLRQHLPLLALSPLLVLETGIGGHVDAFVALSLALALWAFDRARPGIVGLALGLGVTIKLLPGVAIVILALASTRRDAARMILAMVAVVSAAYGLALIVGLTPPGSLPVFFEKWRNGSPVFSLLEAGLSGTSLLLTLGVIACTLGLIALFFLFRSKTISALQLALAIPLIVSPVNFPWYLSALIPALAVSPSAAVLAWVTAAPLVYEVRDRFAVDGTWMPATWPLVVIGAAWVVGLAIDLTGRYRRDSLSAE